MSVGVVLVYFCRSNCDLFTDEGTHDIHALILGKAITGLQAFKPEPNQKPAEV